MMIVDITIIIFLLVPFTRALPNDTLHLDEEPPNNQDVAPPPSFPVLMNFNDEPASSSHAFGSFPSPTPEFASIDNMLVAPPEPTNGPQKIIEIDENRSGSDYTDGGGGKGMDYAEEPPDQDEKIQKLAGDRIGGLPLPRFTLPTTTPKTSATTRAMVLVELEDYPIKQISSNAFKIPKFDLPSANMYRLRMGDGDAAVKPKEVNSGPRGSWQKSSIVKSGLNVGNAEGFTLSSKNNAGADGVGGSVKGFFDGLGKFGKQKGDNDTTSDAGNDKYNAKTKTFMVGITFLTIFAMLLVIFSLTFLLMDRIVSLA